MAKTKKIKAPKFNATLTLTIPPITISSRMLLDLARIDRCELEDILGGDDHLPELEAMLQNPKYLEHLQQSITKMFTPHDMLNMYEDGGSTITTNKAKTIFATELAAAKAAKKQVEAERQADLKGEQNAAILKVSRYDAGRVKMFLKRNDMPFIQVVHPVPESKPVTTPEVKAK